MAPPARIVTPACSSNAVLELVRDLGVSFALAQVLVRRGLGDVEEARAWLAAGEEHAPDRFEGIDLAVAPLLAAASRGERITVHGDYDVDGVASTAILIRTLRSIGAKVDWFLPSRTEDGYGLSAGTVERLAERGTRLLLLSDCGITAVEEVALARERGMDVVVVDHHAPRADGLLPDAAIVHPVVSRYPCPDLCATGVAFKLAGALLERAGHSAAILLADLDLVALATIADCVPLSGENRRLVRTGLRQLARTEKPGLRALMRVAEVDPQRVGAREAGFRLAPRINAAGRVARADAALELLLTHDDARAMEIAVELDSVNSRRRFEEARILHEAESQVAALGEQPAYVLWSENWHPGVIGIVASRIAERCHRPALLIALDGGVGTGSGRSIPAFDLLGGLRACEHTLQRFGGHRAAAGLTVSEDHLEELRRTFSEHAAAVLTPDDLLPEVTVDAVVAGDEIGYSLAEELERLMPFGAGNPPVTLSVPAARLTEPRPIGDGKHLRFTVVSGGVRAQAVAWGLSALPPEADLGHVDAVFSLELNEFRGAVEPRLVLQTVQPAGDVAPTLVGEPDPESEQWSEHVLAVARAASARSLAVVGAPTPAAGGGPVADGGAATRGPATGDRALRVRDRRGGGTAGTIGALVGTGEPVLVVCADAITRQHQLRGLMGGFELCSWDALEVDPSLADHSDHLVALDPPLHERQQALLESLSRHLLVHLAWGDAELRCSRDALDRDLSLRPGLVDAYRALRAGGGIERAFAGRSARSAGRMLTVLSELHLVELGDGGEPAVVAGAPHTDVELSETYRDAMREHEERSRWLSTLGQGPNPARAA